MSFETAESGIARKKLLPYKGFYDLPGMGEVEDEVFLRRAQGLLSLETRLLEQKPPSAWERVRDAARGMEEYVRVCFYYVYLLSLGQEERDSFLDSSLDLECARVREMVLSHIGLFSPEKRSQFVIDSFQYLDESEKIPFVLLVLDESPPEKRTEIMISLFSRFPHYVAELIFFRLELFPSKDHEKLIRSMIENAPSKFFDLCKGTPDKFIP